MKSEDQQKNTIQEEQDINLIEIAQKLWGQRRTILKVSFIAAIVGIIVAISIPKEYTTTVKLSTEKGERRSSNNLGTLAAIAGINLNSASSSAITENIYPDIIHSTPFITILFDVDVKKEGKNSMRLFDYLDQYHRKPWWATIKNSVLSIPSRFIHFFKTKKLVEQVFNPFNLTQKERKILGLIKENIDLSIDKKTGVINLSVTMQDPYISAQLADTIQNRLQEYIINYKTNKARKDEEFSTKLYEEAHLRYIEAQKNYANFTDKNQNIFSHSLRAEQERLQNEMNIAYQTYSQASQQLQIARTRVQENTPTYMVIQPPMVPTLPSKPRKMMIIIGFIFIGIVGCMGWVYFKDQLIEWKKQILTPQPKE